MADRKAVNKYYPPEWEPKHGSINKFRGQHPLRDRARKLDQGILIVRFEMPYNVWCDGCNEHIGRGVRFNAEKKEVGKYFSTKIWSFRMKCHLCGHWMEVRTDPQSRDYVMHEGVRRKVETWTEKTEGVDGTEEEVVYGLPVGLDDKERERLRNDPFAKLEHSADDKKKAETQQERLDSLLEYRDRVSYDDFGSSQKLRRIFREQKKEIEGRKKEAVDLGLGIELLPASEEDRKQAEEIQFRKSKKLASSSSLEPQRFDRNKATVNLLERKMKISSSIFKDTPQYKVAQRRADLLRKAQNSGVQVGLLKLEKAPRRSSSISLSLSVKASPSSSSSASSNT